jgi:signal peptidase I
LDLKFFSHRFWYFVWFIALPAAAAALSAWVLSRLNYFDGPWHVLLAFAVFAVLTYAIRDRLPWWSSSDSKTSSRRIAREAKHLSKETSRMLRRHGQKLDDDVRTQIVELRNRLVRALEDGEGDAVVRAFRKLDVQVDKHLAFARKSTVREYAESIGVAVFVALLLRAFVVEAFKIPSGSMIPTLQIGDHIFVNKFVYGLRIPFTYRFIRHSSTPRRGDVIVFIFPMEEVKDFIKRIVGVGGDVLEMRNGTLFVNGREVEQCPVREVVYEERDEITNQAREQRGFLYLETMDQGDGDRIQYHVLYNGSPSDQRENWGPERVPPGQVYVMGDNRDNSHDSRRWGGVPLENIKGRAWVIWWSNGPGAGLRLRFDPIMDSRPELSRADRTALSRCDEPAARAGPGEHDLETQEEDAERPVEDQRDADAR